MGYARENASWRSSIKHEKHQKKAPWRVMLKRSEKKKINGRKAWHIDSAAYENEEKRHRKNKRIEKAA